MNSPITVSRRAFLGSTAVTAALSTLPQSILPDGLALPDFDLTPIRYSKTAITSLKTGAARLYERFHRISGPRSYLVRDILDSQASFTGSQASNGSGMECFRNDIKLLVSTFRFTHGALSNLHPLTNDTRSPLMKLQTPAMALAKELNEITESERSAVDRCRELENQDSSAVGTLQLAHQQKRADALDRFYTNYSPILKEIGVSSRKRFGPNVAEAILLPRHAKAASSSQLEDYLLNDRGKNDPHALASLLQVDPKEYTLKAFGTFLRDKVVKLHVTSLKEYLLKNRGFSATEVEEATDGLAREMQNCIRDVVNDAIYQEHHIERARPHVDDDSLHLQLLRLEREILL